MHTATGPDGEAVIRRNQAQPGDYLEFVALLDLLVMPNVCGDDLSNCSNFGLRPLRVTIEEGRPEDARQARTARERAAVLGLPRPRRFARAKNIDLYAGDDAAALRDITLSWAIERLGAFTGND